MTTIVVSPRGDDRCAGTADEPVRTVGAAIRQAGRRPALIRVEPGVYSSGRVPGGK